MTALDAALSGSAAAPLRRALQLDALEQQLRPLLPPSLAAHCRLANVTADKLVFLVDSPVWKAKLRLIAPQLVELARSIGLSVTEVTARMQLPVPAPTGPIAPGPAKRPVSAAAREALRTILDTLETTPPATSPGRRRPR